MRRARKRVWFNEGLSSVHDALAIIREADRAGELTLLASHSRSTAPARFAADESWVEPRLPTSEAYVKWCLRTCLEQRVDLLVPGRHREAIGRRAADFASAGTRLLAPGGPDYVALTERKDRYYAELTGIVALPDYRVVRTLEEFDAAYQSLRANHRRICFKPATSVFGVGFHVLVDAVDTYEGLVAGDGLRVALSSFRRALAEARRPRRLLLMEFLPGPERSVDCLAHEGRVVAAVGRVKRGGFQFLETSGPAIDMAVALAARHRLSGLVNVQTRDARGRTRLLEVNARMSGGLLYACMSGTALPYWAVMLALGLREPADVSLPTGGLLVAPVSGARLVGASAEVPRAPRTALRDSPVGSVPALPARGPPRGNRLS